jgi:MFS family permease
MSAIVIGLVFHALIYAVQPATMAEMFPTRMRYSGVSLGYQMTSIVAGSLAPIIAVRLLETYKSAVPIAWYPALSAIAVVAVRETKGVDLADIDVADLHGLARHQDLATRPPDEPEPTPLVEGAV